MIQLTPAQLWEAIYASRNAEKYWRKRRQAGGDPVYTVEELTENLQSQRNTTKMLESLAPAGTW